jgi:hypothetical protein
MIIKLLSVQIPKFWDALKFAVTKADEVESKDLQPYLNELLHALLNDKAQCFVALSDERTLKGVLITRVMLDKATGEKFLFIQSVYAWEKLSKEAWQGYYDLIISFSTNEKCKYLSLNSRNPAVWKLVESYSFTERLRTYTLNIG